MITSVDELKERYKLLPVWARLTVAALIGLGPGIYLYVDQGDVLVQKLTEAQDLVTSNRGKFEEARSKKGNLPQLEEKMAYTEDQLAKAKQKLPDQVIMEDILQKTATIAKQAGVQLTSFNPGADIPHNQPYQYVEQPIATEIQGRFGQVASFLDQMIHLDGTIFLRHIELSRQEGEEKARTGGESDKRSTYDRAVDARRNVQVRTKFDIVVFRSFGEHERLLSTLAAPPPAAAKGKKDPNGPAAAQAAGTEAMKEGGEKAAAAAEKASAVD